MARDASPLDSAQNVPRKRRPGEDDCWNHIGVSGDRSCPELNSHIHCRNCPVFAAAARTFFDRPGSRRISGGLVSLAGRASRFHHARDGDLPRRRSHISHRQGAAVSVLIFRLGEEWLAFRTQAIAEVTLPRPVHRVPHRSNAILVGIVNLQGQVQLCVSLHGLLSVPVHTVTLVAGCVARHRSAETWAFAADEVLGVRRVPRSQWRSVPVDADQSGRWFQSGCLVMGWPQHRPARRTADLHSASESQAMSGDLSGFSLMELFRMEAESHTATLSAGLVSLEETTITPEIDRPLDAGGAFAQRSRTHRWT